jgi:hypothetical protein
MRLEFSGQAIERSQEQHRAAVDSEINDSELAQLLLVPRSEGMARQVN